MKMKIGVKYLISERINLTKYGETPYNQNEKMKEYEKISAIV